MKEIQAWWRERVQERVSENYGRVGEGGRGRRKNPLEGKEMRLGFLVHSLGVLVCMWSNESYRDRIQGGGGGGGIEREVCVQTQVSVRPMVWRGARWKLSFKNRAVLYFRTVVAQFCFEPGKLKHTLGLLISYKPLQTFEYGAFDVYIPTAWTPLVVYESMKEWDKTMGMTVEMWGPGDWRGSLLDGSLWSWLRTKIKQVRKHNYSA